MTLTTKNWTTVTMSSWGGRLALNMTCLLSPLPEPLPNTPAVFSCFNRSSFWFQITLSKTSAAPLLPASIISVSRSPRPWSRGSITTGAQNGKRSGHNSFKMIPNMLFDHIFCTCRYQSLNLNHVREHSMPIYEFRWQRHTQVSHQGKARLRYPVIKWCGGEVWISLVPWQELSHFSLLRGNRPALKHSSGKAENRRAERGELKGCRSVMDESLWLV